MFKIAVKIFILTLSFKINAKNYDGRSVTCADEIGPLLEFSLPNFNEQLEMKKTIKFYQHDNRKFFTINEATFNKKSSPIDQTYHYYTVDFLNKSKTKNLFYFEFYPPSHLMLQNEDNPFTSLVCWE